MWLVGVFVLPTPGIYYAVACDFHLWFLILLLSNLSVTELSTITIITKCDHIVRVKKFGVPKKKK